MRFGYIYSMEAELKPKLQLEEILPAFRLPSTRGQEISLGDYRHRRNLVVYVFHGADCADCRARLKQFAESYGDYQQLNAEVLGVGAADIEDLIRLADELDLPFPLLSDTEGKFLNQVTYPEPETGRPSPALFITDRYGAVYDQWVVPSHDRLPAQTDILTTLGFIEMQCPECGI